MQQELNQGTREWLEWRLQGIGSSDAPALMGKSDYKSKLELWDEKFLKKIEEQTEQTFIQIKGHKIEAQCRSYFELRTGFEWRPRLLVHADFPWVRASMDGFNETLNEGWECKYMGKDMFNRLRNKDLSIMERIPACYLDQIAHQFLVTNARAITLSGVNDTIEVDDYGNKVKNFEHLRIPFTDDIKNYIHTVYVPALFEFWTSIQENVRPEPAKVDAVKIDDEALGKLLVACGKAADEEKKYKKIVEAHKDLIFKHPARTHSKMQYEGLQIAVVPGGSTTDYKAAFEAFCSWLYRIKTAFINNEIHEQEAVQAFIQFPDQPNLEPYMSVRKDSFTLTKAKKEKPIVETYDPAAIDQAHQEAQNLSRTPVLPGHSPAKKVNDDSFNFINPTNGRVPKLWAKKTLEQKVSYCIKEAKDKKITKEQAKIFLDFAELIEKEIERLDELKKEAEANSPGALANAAIDESRNEVHTEQVGNVTFIKGPS